MVEERLLGIKPMDETTAEALFDTITEKLRHCGIEILSMHGQCYDGASNI